MRSIKTVKEVSNETVELLEVLQNFIIPEILKTVVKGQFNYRVILLKLTAHTNRNRLHISQRNMKQDVRMCSPASTNAL